MFSGEDDDDFVPAANASSKLASLFEQSTVKGNPSLTYTAPKQPRKSRSETAQVRNSPTKLDVIIVKEVLTFKLENGHYNSQGKLGAAILGNTASKVYQLLLYKSKQQLITSTKITHIFQFTVQSKNYASFYDDHGQNWSLMFECEDDIIDFTREMGVACATAGGEQNEKPFYVQDLKIGDGIVAELGDLVEIRYTTLPVVNGNMGKAIETNVDADKPQRVKLRKDVWEEALIGGMKGSRKLIILSPMLFGPWKPLVDSTVSQIAVEIEIGRIKSEKRVRSLVSSSAGQHPESSESNVDSSTDETSIKARGASISEALTNSPKTHKASIISRMARMGQATLPLKGAVTCNPSDSEETEEELTTMSSSTLLPKSLSKTRISSAKGRPSAPTPVSTKDVPVSTTGMLNNLPYNAPLTSHQLAVYHTGNVNWNQQQMHQPQAQYLMNGVPVALSSQVDNQIYSVPLSQVVPLPQVSSPNNISPSESHMAVYLAENRTHNAEVRMGIAKVTDKVDQALLKLDKLQQRRGSALEPITLLNSIQKLVSDNEQLQNELLDKRLKIEQQNEKIFQLLSQKVSEQSSTTHSIDQSQDISLQSVIATLQQEKSKLSEDLSEAMANVTKLEDEAKGFEEENAGHKEKINDLIACNEAIQLELEQYKQYIQDQKIEIKQLKDKNEEKMNLCSTLETNMNTLGENIQELQKSRDILRTNLEETKKQLEAAKKQLEISIEKSSDYQDNKDKIVCTQEDIQKQISSHTRQLKIQYEEIIRKMDYKYMDLVEEINHLKSELKTASQAQKSLPGDDVKKVMNVLFKLLKSEFITTSSYDGSSVMQIILSTIQDVTIQYLNMKSKSSVHSSENRDSKEKVVMSNSSERKGEDSINQTICEKVSTYTGDFSSVESENSAVNADCIRENYDSSRQSKVEPNIQIVDQDNEAKEEQCKVKAIDNTAELHDPLSVKESKAIQSVEQDIPVKEEKIQEIENKPANQIAEQVDKLKDTSLEKSWRPQPPPPPQFDEDEDDDDWLS